MTPTRAFLKGESSQLRGSMTPQLTHQFENISTWPITMLPNVIFYLCLYLHCRVRCNCGCVSVGHYNKSNILICYWSGSTVHDVRGQFLRHRGGSSGQTSLINKTKLLRSFNSSNGLHTSRDGYDCTQAATDMSSRNCSLQNST